MNYNELHMPRFSFSFSEWFCSSFCHQCIDILILIETEKKHNQHNFVIDYTCASFFQNTYYQLRQKRYTTTPIIYKNDFSPPYYYI